VSGTIDESIRHSVSKLAHLHFVANEEAKKRLLRMGEDKANIYVVGSPDIDLMLSEELPTLEDAKRRYEIPFRGKYSLLAYHPITTNLHNLLDDFKTALFWHGDVKQEDVGLQRGDLLEHLFAVLRFADDLIVWLVVQDRLDPFAEDVVIIGYENVVRHISYGFFKDFKIVLNFP